MFLYDAMRIDVIVSFRAKIIFTPQPPPTRWETKRAQNACRLLTDVHFENDDDEMSFRMLMRRNSIASTQRKTYTTKVRQHDRANRKRGDGRGKAACKYFRIGVPLMHLVDRSVLNGLGRFWGGAKGVQRT